MKTMTCQQLGGPCGFQLRGDTADQVIRQQDQHLKDAVAGGDSTHEQANNEMRGRWKHPKRSLDWYNGTKRAFAEAPED